MPRPAKNIVWREDDGRFHVTVAARTDRPGFRVRSGFRGGRLDTRSAVTQAEAEALAGGIWRAYQLGAIEAPEVAPETLGQLTDCIEKRTDLSPKTVASYRRVWMLLVRAVGESRPLKRLYRMDVEAWLVAYSGQTRATYLRTLRAGFSWARSKGWMQVDPTQGITATVKHELGAWLPYGHWPALLNACTVGHQIRAGFVLETGMRAGEIMAARWDWIREGVGKPAIVIAHDPVSGFTPKWGRPRSVPLSAKALAWLDDARRHWGETGYIFSTDGLAWPQFARETAKACERAKVGPVTFHGLRRSAGAHWLACGVSMKLVGDLLGHATMLTTERWYAGVGESSLVGAIDQVETVERDRAGVRSIGPAFGPRAKTRATPEEATPATPRRKRV
jgi:integrase